MRIYAKDLTKDEMSKSLVASMELLGILETVLTSESSDLESCREGMRIIIVNAEDGIAHVLESLEALNDKAAKTA